MKVFKTFLTFFILLFAANALFAQTQYDSEINVKSTMVYSFVRYFQWPSQADGNTRVIGIYGDAKFYELMKSKYHQREKNGKKIIIEKIKNLEDATSCHIIYLGKHASNKFQEFKNLIEDKPVLLVTNSRGLGKLGSCVNFTLRDKKVKFELNKKAIQQKQLMVSSTLTKLAVMI